MEYWLAGSGSQSNVIREGVGSAASSLLWPDRSQFTDRVHFIAILVHKQLEVHGLVLSMVATDALLLKRQVINTHSADYIFILLFSTKSKRGYTGFTLSVRPSVTLYEEDKKEEARMRCSLLYGSWDQILQRCPSVRLWTESCPLCIFYNTPRIHFIFTHLIKQLQMVCCV